MHTSRAPRLRRLISTATRVRPGRAVGIHTSRAPRLRRRISTAPRARPGRITGMRTSHGPRPRRRTSPAPRARTGRITGMHTSPGLRLRPDRIMGTRALRAPQAAPPRTLARIQAAPASPGPHGAESPGFLPTFINNFPRASFRCPGENASACLLLFRRRIIEVHDDLTLVIHGAPGCGIEGHGLDQLTNLLPGSG